MVEDAGGDVEVVADEVALRQPVLREEDLVRVGEGDVAAVHAHDGSIVSSVIEEPQRLSLALEPLDDYVVIEPSDEETETRHGLIIPASAEAGCQTGIVTAVGAEAVGIEPGDKVLFPKEAGFDVRLAGAAMKVIRRGDLIARVHD